MWAAFELTDTKQINEALALRYVTFAERLKWIPENPNKRDMDKYDLYSRHVGVYHDEKLTATARITPYGLPWMLTEVFSYIPVSIDPDSVEFSRLSINGSLPFAERAMSFGLLTYKVAQLCTQRYAYSVTTKGRSILYQRFGVIFDEVGRYDTCDEELRVLRIRIQETDWKGIAEAHLLED